MQLNILAFGITKDIVGGASVTLNIPNDISVKELKKILFTTYPDMARLQSLLIAVNEEYGEDNYIINESDDIALIPPVSGG